MGRDEGAYALDLFRLVMDHHFVVGCEFSVGRDWEVSKVSNPVKTTNIPQFKAAVGNAGVVDVS